MNPNDPNYQQNGQQPGQSFQPNQPAQQPYPQQVQQGYQAPPQTQAPGVVNPNQAAASQQLNQVQARSFDYPQYQPGIVGQSPSRFAVINFKKIAIFGGGLVALVAVVSVALIIFRSPSEVEKNRQARQDLSAVMEAISPIRTSIDANDLASQSEVATVLESARNPFTGDAYVLTVGGELSSEAIRFSNKSICSSEVGVRAVQSDAVFTVAIESPAGTVLCVDNVVRDFTATE